MASQIWYDCDFSVSVKDTLDEWNIDPPTSYSLNYCKVVIRPESEKINCQP